MQQFLPVGVLGAFTSLLTRPEWYIAVLAGIGLMVLLAVLNHVPGRAPLFLWLRRESRWFLTTTFLQSAARHQSTSVRLPRPVRSWGAIAARAYDVAEALREGGRFPLQLYVLALLDDLRNNHRRGSWDLRGFKRTRPPVLFLRRTALENGGIELIRAVSDVRSRRSELDPLLIVAGVAADDAPLLDRGADGSPQAPPPPSRYQPSRLQQRLRNWYDEWAGNLRAGQSPSRTNALPWVLRIPLPREELVQVRETDRRCVRARHRLPLVRVVWSAYSLTLAVVLACTAGGVHSYELHRTYCSADLLTANRDTERHSAPGDGTECIGLATGDVRFGAYLRDTGDEEADEQGGRLHDLEDRIHDENARVLRGHSGTYVTVVYAGPLSSSRLNPSPVKGVEELTGVYLAQRVVNENHTVKMRVLLANGGADMGHQSETAEAIAAYAERDPTFVGVVGFGRDLQSSPGVTDRLHKAEVPVVSGTNSASYLPKEFSNWFSLAAPDEHQAEALGHVARQLRTPGRATYALVLARDLKGSQDRYTSEQAAYGEEMLKRERFRMLPTQEYRVVNGDPELRLHAERTCQGENVPSVIYFAGRVEDVGPLMTQLCTQPGCANKEISILTGDDLSKARFSGTGGSDRGPADHAVPRGPDRAGGRRARHRLLRGRRPPPPLDRAGPAPVRHPRLRQRSDGPLPRRRACAVLGGQPRGRAPEPRGDLGQPQERQARQDGHRDDRLHHHAPVRRTARPQHPRQAGPHRSARQRACFLRPGADCPGRWPRPPRSGLVRTGHGPRRSARSTRCPLPVPGVSGGSGCAVPPALQPPLPRSAPHR
ncbi:ABC transporter substrate-binding protein [Streptomyces sp. NBRC 110035]|uniref:ABC transporter substrate-binding protein n=1 Tax=Streptomyces sp. NBRC 110035 TaxID=1547867 RepID=UPI001F20C156|nr:ABC transporter substrate-binding protein [Streptomyces sp. NBRC 110035]